MTEKTRVARRFIWVSLPSNIRLASFFSRLAVSIEEAFGQTVYAEFLEHDILEGMPPIQGKPASEFDTSKKPIVRRLPSGYGRDFGKRVYIFINRKVRSPEFTEEIMSDFLVRFLETGSKGLERGRNRAEAESYVFKGIQREMMNAIRYLKQRKRDVTKKVDPYYRGEEGEVIERDFPVYDDDETLEKQIKTELPRIKSKLNIIHPDAALYLQLALGGYTDMEIIGDVAKGKPSLLTHPYSKQGQPLNNKFWGVVYKPKIYEVLKTVL